MVLGSITLESNSVLIRFKPRCLAFGRLFNYFKLAAAVGRAAVGRAAVGRAAVGRAAVVD